MSCSLKVGFYMFLLRGLTCYSFRKGLPFLLRFFALAFVPSPAHKSRS